MKIVFNKKVKTGPGLLEFLDEGNILPFPSTPNSMDIIVDYLIHTWGLSEEDRIVNKIVESWRKSRMV